MTVLIYHLIFFGLIFDHTLNEKVENLAKSGRLFSNPFGVFGNDACESTLQDRNVTGICYNEVECLLK